jgi:4-alpha-glucanotransferase
MNDDAAVRELARRVGIAVEWRDSAERPQVVVVPVLRRVLAALGFPAATSREIAESGRRLDAEAGPSTSAPLVTATVGEPVELVDPDARSRETALLVMESGVRRDIMPERVGNRLTLPGVAEPGYHTLYVGDRAVTLAAAPKRCFSPRDITPQPRMWGVAVQLYGLRRAGDGGIGSTAALAALATGATKFGADAIALSPTHAMFGADVARYGPYSPSSRLFLNPLHADPGTIFGEARVASVIGELALTEQWTALEAADLIDWPRCAAAKLAVLRRLFESVGGPSEHGDPGSHGRALADFRARGGDLLEEHALFESLHASRLAVDRQCWSWRKWPSEWQDPRSTHVRAFAAANAHEIAFQVFLQWIADRSLAATQAHARAAGMRIGLIADLAVGMDAGGSHAWSRQRDLVVGLNVGAPPDVFNPHGQDWGLTAFSPRVLVAGGFAPFIATLRAALRHAGGVRIDHAMGLRRLWLVPEGAAPTEGAYLAYPLDDLVRLIKLESFRHRAIVIGEDLGTVPEGFRQGLLDAGIAGMRALWFERDGKRFRPPQAWPPHAAAMTSTHDLPTVAGWWRGADIDVRARLGLLGPDGDANSQKRKRAHDRRRLWAAFREAGIAAHQHAPENAADAVDAAVRFVAATPAQLALIPLEDMLGLSDQPNLPGTVDEHPNWRRRYPGDARTLFEASQVQRRAESLRHRSPR